MRNEKIDWEVWRVLKKEWFAPPFHTENELKVILEKLYENIEMQMDGSFMTEQRKNKRK